MNLPIKSSHCNTTHTACECILDNMNKLEEENSKLKKAVEYCNQLILNKGSAIIGQANQIAKLKAELESLEMYLGPDKWADLFGGEKKGPVS